MALGSWTRVGTGAEVALLVEDSWQRRGIGTALLDVLVAGRTRRRGVSVDCLVLSESRHVLRMLRRAATRTSTNRRRCPQRDPDGRMRLGRASSTLPLVLEVACGFVGTYGMFARPGARRPALGSEQEVQARVNILEGIRIVDTTMFAFMPVAGGVLSQWGADVIKVEGASGPDPMRLLSGGTLEPGAPTRRSRTTTAASAPSPSTSRPTTAAPSSTGSSRPPTCSSRATCRRRGASSASTSTTSAGTTPTSST